MSLPDFTRYINPLLSAIRKLGGAARPKQVFQTIARDLGVSNDVLEVRLASGALKFENQIAWARWYLVDTGFIDGSRRGIWKLTDKAWATEFLTDEALRDVVDRTHDRHKIPYAEEAEGQAPEESADEWDVAKLKDLYNSDSVARGFLEHVAARERNQGETSVDRALQILRNGGADVSRQQIISVFRGLETCGCGEFVAGRHGFPSRFVWSTAMISVGRAAAGEQEEVEQLPTEDEELNRGDSWLTHSFQLRPQMTLEIDLPANLSSKEAQRIARFIETLPFDDES